MARLGKLTKTFVQRLCRSGVFADRGSHGLAVRVRPTKRKGLSKTWIQRIRIDGKVTYLGLGSYPTVSLDEARQRARANWEAVQEGRDPRVRKMPTFRQAARVVIKKLSAAWRPGGRTRQRWEDNLRTFVLPLIGNKPVGLISSADVMACLERIWHTKPETARQVLSHIRAVLEWAKEKGFRGDNPANVVSVALGPVMSRVRHMPALHHSLVANALEAVRASNAYWATVAAFEFQTLTATRHGEVRGARWSEIDLAAAIWTISSHRTKAGIRFRVPLSRAALAVLDQAWERTGGVGLVFPSRTGEPLSSATLSKLLRENRVGCVPHGMRSSFRDWCAETGVPEEVAEVALSHTVRKAGTTGTRLDLLPQRRVVMEMWGLYLSGATSPN